MSTKFLLIFLSGCDVFVVFERLFVVLSRLLYEVRVIVSIVVDPVKNDTHLLFDNDIDEKIFNLHMNKTQIGCLHLRCVRCQFDSCFVVVIYILTLIYFIFLLNTRVTLAV